jgi:hypothetical protein
MSHRVAPHALVDVLALDHPAARVGEHLEELELAARQADAAAGDESLELVGPDLDLAGNDRAGLERPPSTVVATHHGLDPGDHLLRMAGLRDPVVGSEPKAADSLRDGRVGGADDQPEAGQQSAHLVDELPRVRLQHAEVDHQRVELHRDELVRGHYRGEHAVLPTRRLETLREHREEAAIRIDDG